MPNLQNGFQLSAWVLVLALSVWAWRIRPIADEPDWNALGVSRGESIVYREDGARCG